MRANPAEYALQAPGTLAAVLSLLSSEPGTWLPIAGGTDVMVQYAAGKLAARKLVSVWNLPELRRIDVTPNELSIGAGCTYSDLRQHEIIRREFPLLSTAARWTGSIANQNRGTLGGNIVNASPAADSLPALHVYEAELQLISAHGDRRVPYADFHVDYRKTRLAPDELILAVCLERQFSDYYHHARKIGARNAQAISKICLSALGKMQNGVISDIRLAMGSVAPVPLRLTATEQQLKGKGIHAALLALAKSSAAAEIRPIDDIRSTSRYRAAVAGNLVAEFLERLTEGQANLRVEATNAVLARWNNLEQQKAADEILPCNGSKSWAQAMAARRPIHDEATVVAASDEIWRRLPESDWLEAFASHPRIGESRAPATATSQSATWSSQEQRAVSASGDDTKAALADANRAYENRFHRIFIVCATGKSPSEILQILNRRLNNDDRTEFRESTEEQLQITQLRLKKWLNP